MKILHVTNNLIDVFFSPLDWKMWARYKITYVSGKGKTLQYVKGNRLTNTQEIQVVKGLHG